MNDGRKAALLAQARALGFAEARVTTPDGIGPAGQRLRSFLEADRHGDMAWMKTHADRRADPLMLWPAVRSIVMLGHSYAPDRDPLTALAEPKRGVISVYAQGHDYHDVIKAKLKVLARTLTDTGTQARVFVDTAPLMEKPLAAAAGIGWQGKHTNLVSRTHGSWLFLGAVLTSAELTPDGAEADHCGSCRRCLDVCPTAAFPAPYQLDARRCIAYLTIEHRGLIAEEFRKPMGNRVFGCDDCLAVCPWNKFAETSADTKQRLREEADHPPLGRLLALDDAGFRKRYAGTPIKRTGRDRFVRNVLIAAGNSGDEALLPAVEQLLSDASPLVRAMAVWAIRQLAPADRCAGLRATHAARERDGEVRAEWGWT